MSYKVPTADPELIFEHILQYYDDPLSTEDWKELRRTTIRVYKALKMIQDIFNEFRQEDVKKYKDIRDANVGASNFPNLYGDLFLQANGWMEACFSYILSTYDDSNFRRRLLAFYLEFDASDDRKMQQEELSNCLEYLGRPELLGKEKILRALKYVGVEIDKRFTFLQEGSASKKLVTQDKLNEFWGKLIQVDEFTEQSEMRKQGTDYLEFKTFIPFIVIFFMEYEAKLVLDRHQKFNQHLGFPTKLIIETGKKELDIKGSPSGIYKTLLSVLRERRWVEDQISYRDIVRALNKYRSHGFTEQLTLEGLERIYKEIREAMDVDLGRGREGKTLPIKTILPKVAYLVCRECSWKFNEQERFHSSEIYDIKVHWEAGANCERFNRTEIHEKIMEQCDGILSKTKEQFQMLLLKVLKDLIPSIRKEVVAYIVEQYKNSEFVFSEGGELRFNIQKIVTEDDIFDRIYTFAWNFLLPDALYILFSKRGHAIRAQAADYVHLNKLTSKLLHLDRQSLGKVGLFKHEIAQNLLQRISQNDDDNYEVEHYRMQRDIKLKRIIEDFIGENDRRDIKKKTLKFTKQDTEESDDDIEQLETKYLQKTMMQETTTKENQEEEGDKLLGSEQAIRAIELQAEANKIDRMIALKKHEKSLKENKGQRYAFPNSMHIRPQLVMAMLEQSSLETQSIIQLKNHLAQEGGTITFEDLNRIITAQKLGLLKDSTKNAKKLLKILGKQQEKLDKKSKHFEETEYSIHAKQLGKRQDNLHIMFTGTRALYQDRNQALTRKKNRDVKDDRRECKCSVI